MTWGLILFWTSILVWIGAAGSRAGLDLRSLPRRPPGLVRRLFVVRAVASGASAFGVCFACLWPVVWPYLVASPPPQGFLAFPTSAVLPLLGAMCVALLGGVAALAATHFIHARRIVSSLAPFATQERFR